MKRSLIPLFLAAAAISCPASIIPFQLSPPGTDVAVGLSPSNEVPIVSNSTGSGNAISGGILFDTDTKVLQFAIGYGSAAGFTDLTGSPTTADISGPAAPGQNAGVLFRLDSYIFPSPGPARGGVIFGNIPFPTDQVSNLLAGVTYVNIHTALNPGGEIRGQLVPAVNSPPTVSCGADMMVECGTPTTLTALVSDPDGDALTVVWTVNGTGVQTNTLPAGAPSATTPVSFTGTLPLGTNAVAVLVIDTATNTASCGSMVTVVDTTPPVITSVKANPNVLWPPNHKMVSITLRVGATDSCSAATWKIIGVTSSEPVNGLGDGDTAPDWQIVGDHGLKLRAERSGKGKGRTYTITVRAADTSGNLSAPRSVTVKVPKSQGQ